MTRDDDAIDIVVSVYGIDNLYAPEPYSVDGLFRSRVCPECGNGFRYFWMLGDHFRDHHPERLAELRILNSLKTIGGNK